MELAWNYSYYAVLFAHMQALQVQGSQQQVNLLLNLALKAFMSVSVSVFRAPSEGFECVHSTAVTIYNHFTFWHV